MEDDLTQGYDPDGVVDPYIQGAEQLDPSEYMFAGK